MPTISRISLLSRLSALTTLCKITARRFISPSCEIKITNKALGQCGELIARWYLRAHRHSIVAQNWQDGPREIDVISRTTSYLHIIEVKTRRIDRTKVQNDPMNYWPFSAAKGANISRAAAAFIEQHEKHALSPLRYDGILITYQTPARWPWRLRYFPHLYGETTITEPCNYSGWIKGGFSVPLRSAKARLRQGYGGASPACPAVALAKEDEAARKYRFYLCISHFLCLCLIQGRVVTEPY